MTTITEFANELYENSRAKGFYDHEDMLREIIAATGKRSWLSRLFDRVFGGRYPWRRQARIALAEHYGNRLLLIAGEAVEAHEELRAGRGVGELYFRGKNERGEYLWHEPNAPITGELLKPEGVLAELADVAIRSLETIAGILAQLDEGEAEKLREQVPASEHTTIESTGDEDGVFVHPVNVAEVLNLKHEFNLSRAKCHGGKAF